MHMKQKITVGFIGLGLMGNPMAKNILKAGFSLNVYNRTLSKTEELKKLGARVFLSPKEIAQNSDIVISMVTAPEDVKEVMTGKNGVEYGAKKGLIAVDMSTIGPSAAKEIGRHLEKHGVDFLDAPVTGSTPKAITGELAIFIGGKKETYKKTKNVFCAMGTNLQYIGPMGSGQAVKLVNNVIIAATVVGLAEGVLMGEVFGLSKEKISDALKDVPAFSMYMRLKMENFLKENYAPIFTLKNMKKDLYLAYDELKKAGYMKKMKAKFPLFYHIARLYKKGIADGLGGEDMCAVFKVLQEA